MGYSSVIAIIQARMNSERLPGKAMRHLVGRALLQHVLDRLKRCATVDGLWIATSTSSFDDAIADFAKQAGAGLYRGELDNVAKRMLGAATAASAGALVRINGDSPLIDPEIVDNAVALYRNETPDLVTNVLRRTFPKGQSVEVIAVSALALACREMRSASDREHVTTWFYANPNRVRIIGFESKRRRDSYQLSVDTQHDLNRAEAILLHLGEPAAEHGLEAIIAAADSIERRASNDRK